LYQATKGDEQSQSSLGIERLAFDVTLIRRLEYFPDD
jgi:hypothetical protein